MVGTDAAFVLDGVSVEYPNLRALDDVSVRIDGGEAVAVVGPSGSGKTTLLHVLNGSVRPAGGTIRVHGRPLGDMTARELRRTRASIGFVHQDLRLVPNLRVHHNVIAGRFGRLSFSASLRAMLLPPRRLKCDVYEVLERVGIAEKLFERTDRLSGGQQQRVAIARALFQQPVALLADEPVSSVDPARAKDSVQLLTRLSRELGMTLCVSLHHLELAREFFPRLIGLRRGRIIFDQAPSELSHEQFEALYRLDAAELFGEVG